MRPAVERRQGPFTLSIVRRVEKTEKNNTGLETTGLKGTVAKEDVEGDAVALLTDPRDTIIRVLVWSEREDQHITTYRKEDVNV